MASGNAGFAARAPALVSLACLAVAVLAMLWLTGRPIATDDLWWHLALGEAYTENGLSLDEDPLFHTSRAHPTVPHEWLFQVAVHGIERVGGFTGLRGVHVLLVAAILAWSFAVFRRAAGGVAPAALATAVLIALSWYRLFQFRPELVSLLAILGLYTLVLERDEPPTWGRIAAVLVLLVVWANAHSLFAMGPALLIAALVGTAGEQGLRRITADAAPDGAGPGLQRLALLLVAGSVVTALNPRGFEQHATFFVESASGDIWLLNDDFLPWNPFEPVSRNPALHFYSWLVADALLLATLVAAGTAGLRFARERSTAALRALDLPHLALAAAGLVAMLVAARFHWMALFPLLYLLRALRLRGGEATRSTWSWLCATACAVVALGFPRGVDVESFRRELLPEPGGYWRTPWIDARYCGPAMRFLRDRGIEGRMFHPFNLGGFLGYWLAPQLRTFIDGRLDHVPSEVIDDYLHLRRAARLGNPFEIHELLDKWEIDVFVGTTFPSNRYTEGSWVDHVRRLHNWTPVYTTQSCAVLLRRSEANRENLQRTASWWREQRIPFSKRSGPDMNHAIRNRPGWAMREGIVPGHFERLARPDPDALPADRTYQLDHLAETLWRVGAFVDSVRVDQLLLELEPDSKQARWRLADALIQLGRPRDALEFGAPLCESDPGWRNAATLCGIARARLRMSGGPDQPGESVGDP